MKTNEIAPGETQTVSVSFDVSKMASYDDAGKTGNKSAWVLEAGDYTIYVGNSVRTAEKAGVWTLDALRVTEQLTEANAIESGKGFDRMIPSAGKPLRRRRRLPTSQIACCRICRRQLP